MSKAVAQMPQTDISYLPTLDSLLSLIELSEGCGWNLSAETYNGFRLPGFSLMFFEVKIALNGQGKKSILLICFEGLNLGKDIDFVLKVAIYDNQTGSFLFCVCDRTLTILPPPSLPRFYRHVPAHMAVAELHSQGQHRTSHLPACIAQGQGSSCVPAHLILRTKLYQMLHACQAGTLQLNYTPSPQTGF